MATKELKGKPVKGTGPEIYLLENGSRRWIPDALTFDSLGLDWNSVAVIDDEELDSIPVGDLVPTVIPAQQYPDGSFLTDDGETVYVTKGGKLQLVPDMMTFTELGGKERPVHSISSAELRALPVDQEVLTLGAEAQADVRIRTLEVSVYTFLGAGHHMWTNAGMLTSAGLLQANTRTKSQTWFGGFTGGVEITIQDRDGFIIWITPPRRFGVDGTAIGRSDRTDYWEANPPREIIDQATTLAVAHFWSPNWQQNLNRWLAVGTQIATAIGAIRTQVSGGAGGGVGPPNPP
jgi:hypothetical protein